jgi:hypothetical protein
VKLPGYVTDVGPFRRRRRRCDGGRDVQPERTVVQAMKVLGVDDVFLQVGDLDEAVRFRSVEIRNPWGNTTGFTDYVAKPELGRG